MTTGGERGEDVRDAIRVLAAAVFVAVTGVAAACDSMLTETTAVRRIEADAVALETAPGLVFMTLKIDPEAEMEALYEGAVTVDERGCVRLATPEAHAVIWPMGFGFEAVNGGFRVLDAAGARVGEIPGDFTLAGGEVEVLPPAMGFTSADQTLASTHCPGRYWIGRPAD